MDDPPSVPSNREVTSLGVDQVCCSVPEALPTRTRDSAPQKVWVRVEGFVTKKQPKPVSSGRELSPPQVLYAEFFWDKLRL